MYRNFKNEYINSQSNWCRAVIFKHDETVEDIPLEYPNEVEDVLSWWSEEQVRERRPARERMRIELREMDDAQNRYDKWLERCDTPSRVDEYLKTSEADE